MFLVLDVPVRNLLPSVAVFEPYTITWCKRPIGRDSTIFHLFLKQDSFTYDYNLALTDICNNKVDCRKNDIGNKLTTQLSVFLKKSRFIFSYNAKENQT